MNIHPPAWRDTIVRRVVLKRILRDIRKVWGAAAAAEVKTCCKSCCKRGVALLCVLSLMLLPVVPEIGVSEAYASGQTSKKSSGRKSGGKSSSGKKSTSKKSSRKSGKRRSSGKSGSKSETSADVRRRQEDAQREVARTKEEIRQNEASIRKSLSELSKIDEDITVSRREVGVLQGKVSGLQRQINGLESQIADNTRKLETLRGEYLKAVKRMRGSRKRNSKLAFVFSSKGLGQAERRMRYLKEFARWRDNQTQEINKTVASLKEENAKLLRAKSDYDVMLGRQVKVQTRLESQQKVQNKIVSDLKANGTALQNHLARKQAEVNDLRNRVASLIAAEERKAAEERRREEERQAAAEAKRRAEEERLARAEREKSEAAEKESAAAKDVVSDNTSRSRKESKEERKKADAAGKKRAGEKQVASRSGKKSDKSASSGKSEGKDYASARKRRPRGSASSSSGGGSASSKSSNASKSAASSSDGFASMKGRLPRPVSGAFRITSPFGRHALPDLPDVMYDNPGIDAEVSAGATARAVYAGKISGVYMIPGFATVVIVNHGDYYTVYGNIASASVKVGDTVRQGDSVGRVAEDPDNPGMSSIHFEVWKNRDKLNPASWIQ